jgi:hypothetical protein
MCEKMLFVFTSPGWPEFERHWGHLEEAQKSFSGSKGKVLPFDGKGYRGHSGWKISQIIEVTKNPIAESKDGMRMEELAILIHDTADDTLTEITNQLSQTFSELSKPPLVHGYSGAADNNFFMNYIKPIGREASLDADHFDRLWDFIWTDDSHRKAIENRSRTLLPFLSLHLLKTANCVPLPEDVRDRIINEINQSRGYYNIFFDSLTVPTGKCIGKFNTLKNVAEAGLQNEDFQEMSIEALGGSIQTLLDCLNTHLTEFMNNHPEAA